MKINTNKLTADDSDGIHQVILLTIYVINYYQFPFIKSNIVSIMKVKKYEYIKEYIPYFSTFGILENLKSSEIECYYSVLLDNNYFVEHSDGKIYITQKGICKVREINDSLNLQMSLNIKQQQKYIASIEMRNKATDISFDVDLVKYEDFHTIVNNHSGEGNILFSYNLLMSILTHIEFKPLMKGFSPRTKDIFLLHFNGLNRILKSFKDIGVIYDRTQERMRQIMKKGFVSTKKSLVYDSDYIEVMSSITSKGVDERTYQILLTTYYYLNQFSKSKTRFILSFILEKKDLNRVMNFCEKYLVYRKSIERHENKIDAYDNWLKENINWSSVVSEKGVKFFESCAELREVNYDNGCDTGIYNSDKVGGNISYESRFLSTKIVTLSDRSITYAA